MIAGIDISKKTFDVVFLPQNLHYSFPNTEAGLNKFIKLIKKSEEPLQLIALENTGGFEKLAVKLLSEAGYPVHIASGKKVHYFAKMKGYLSKTDKQDALIIAEYASQTHISENAKEYLKDIELRELQARENQLKGMVADEKKRLQNSMFSKQTIRSMQRMIKNLENEIKLINSKIDLMLKADKEKQEAIERYQTVKGIGPVTAKTLVICLPELGHRSRTKIAALCGVAPINNDSGIRQGYRSTRGGRAAVKKALYMAAISASRYNIELRDYYQRLLKQGKKAKVALMAVMRKLLLILNAMERDKVTWQSKPAAVACN